MTRHPSLNRVALAVAALAFQTSQAHAQDPAVPAAAASSPAPSAPASAASAAAVRDEPMSLDRIVVTGTTGSASKMKQSVSISTMEAEDIQNSGAASVAELLRNVPGVHAENSGGEGNANVTVRGVPISAGGSRYVQFQEDGLPVLLFGDIAFGTPDQFLRTDYNIDHLEFIRGGSASTLVSNAPGGVVNFISKTGESAGGAAGLTLGLSGGTERRLDLDYGGKLGAGTYFHIGGFNRVGEGDRPTGFNASNGGQIKASLTQMLDNGFIRINFKALDDRTPTLLPVPVVIANGHVSTIPGIDPRTAYFITPGNGPDVVLGPNGTPVSTNPADGLHVTSNAFGAQGQFNLADGWIVDDKFRKSSNSGRFIGVYPNNNGNGATPATSTTFNGVFFNTSINDLGNTFNDLKVSKTFGGASGTKTTVTAGLFSSLQNVGLTWDWNNYNVALQNTGGTAKLAGSGFTTFGGCCVRNFDVQYSNTAPYGAITFETGGLTLDGSLRYDRQHASGWAQSGDAATGTWSTTIQPVGYSLNHTSYSLGANYALNKDLALFARASDGVAFSADRLLYGTPLNGTVPVAVNEVKQIEGGVKYRSGGLNLFATVFDAKTSESNYEATTQAVTANKYDAYGLELELGYHTGMFRLTGGATLTRSRITDSLTASNVGNTPQRLAKVLLQAAPSVVFGNLEAGASLVYTGQSYGDDANQTIMPAFAVVNAFANYALGTNAMVSVSVNNLTNTIGYTEFDGISGSSGASARSINGRTVKATLKYTF